MREDLPRAASGRAHNLPLDSVRGIAALAIVLHHVVISQTFGQAFRFDGVAATVLANAWILVDLFFVLSGIVMAMNYGRPAGRFRTGDFLIRRVARIYPLHLVMLLVAVGLRGIRVAASAAGAPVAPLTAAEVNTPYAFVMHLFLLNALGTLGSLSWNGPSWSISAELYAYVVFAGLIAWLAARRGLSLAGPVFALVALGALLATLFVLGERSLEFHYRFGVVRCLYSFAIGVVVFRIAEAMRTASPAGGRIAGPVQWLLVPTIVALVWSIGAREWISLLAPLVFALFLGSLLVGDRTSLARLLSVRPLVWLGQRSYSVYMIHSALVVLAEYAYRAVGIGRVEALDRSLHGGAGLVAMAGLVAIVLILSDFTFTHIEKPGSRLVLSLFRRVHRESAAPDLRERR